MKKLAIILMLGLVVGNIEAAPLKILSSLPDYYAPVFRINGSNLKYAEHSVANKIEKWKYSTEDEALELVVELIPCDGTQRGRIFDYVLNTVDARIKKNEGCFLNVTGREMQAEILCGETNLTVFVYSLPKSIQIWTYSTKPECSYDLTNKHEEIRMLVGRQRYMDALAEGNVAMGHWGDEIHEFASRLLKNGEKQKALAILKSILLTSPYNYKAHMDYASNTSDKIAANTSAKIVFEMVEDPEILSRAAKFMGKKPLSLKDIPVLNTNDTGMQVVLIPLEPCSLWYLNEVAETYQKMTDIPVTVRRLREKWAWSSTPERIHNHRSSQKFLAGIKDETIDFEGWTKERYIKELRSAVATNGALAVYYTEQYIKDIKDKPGQYFGSPYLNRFCRMLMPDKTSDCRTMYVGITEANIYSGDNNYVFSLGIEGGKKRASILSYHMMLASTLRENHGLRERLVERIAKELVPASIKQLGIPRSMDPRCPYSYSSGVSRLDEKTLKLSDSLQKALKRLRSQPQKEKPVVLKVPRSG